MLKEYFGVASPLSPLWDTCPFITVKHYNAHSGYQIPIKEYYFNLFRSNWTKKRLQVPHPTEITLLSPLIHRKMPTNRQRKPQELQEKAQEIHQWRTRTWSRKKKPRLWLQKRASRWHPSWRKLLRNRKGNRTGRVSGRERDRERLVRKKFQREERTVWKEWRLSRQVNISRTPPPLFNSFQFRYMLYLYWCTCNFTK